MQNPYGTPPEAGGREPRPGGEAWGSEWGFYAAGATDRSARHEPPPRSSLDFSPLFALLDALRRAAPDELQGRLTGLIRETLLTLRSLIDSYLERLDPPPRQPRVEDIPID